MKGPERKNNRLETWNYSSNGGYFITICTENRKCLLSHITISRVIQQMKGYATKQIGHSIWQKSFHDHIIRNDRDYQRIWAYIDTNPAKWEQDCFYTEE